MMLNWLALSVGGFALALGAHAIACRFPLRADRVTRFLIVGIVAGAGLTWILIGQYEMSALDIVAALLVYAFACELYIFLFTMTIGSISSNILVRLLRQEMRISDVALAYDSEQMVRQRIDRLIGIAFLERRQNGVALTAKGNRFVLVFRRLRRFFGQG